MARRIIVVFGMAGCHACAEYLPQLDRVAKNFPQIQTLAIDSDAQPQLADRFLITATPTTLLLEQPWWSSDWVVLWREEGGLDQEQLQQLFRRASS